MCSNEGKNFTIIKQHNKEIRNLDFCRRSSRINEVSYQHYKARQATFVATMRLDEGICLEVSDISDTAMKED